MMIAIRCNSLWLILYSQFCQWIRTIDQFCCSQWEQNCCLLFVSIQDSYDHWEYCTGGVILCHLLTKAKLSCDPATTSIRKSSKVLTGCACVLAFPSFCCFMFRQGRQSAKLLFVDIRLSRTHL